MRNWLIKGTFFFIIILSLISNVYALDDITVYEDNDSTYIPTNIINGGFDECPWVAFKLNGETYSKSILDSGKSFTDGIRVELIYNGTNGGWNTTTNLIYDDGKLFDWTKKANGVVVKHAINATYNGSLQTGANYSFIEMNGHEAAVFYQDLNTIGGDVIRWTLNHGIRPTSTAPAQQNISVEIGAPNTKDGKIVTAHGTGDDLYTEIESKSSAKYTKDGVTNGSLNSGSANLEELKNLSLSKSSQASKWYDARGVYVIPNNQNVTRFAFRSDVNNADGNLLDEITFSTLIGNLNATFNEDKTVTVKGYWGETDPNKKLVIRIGEDDYYLDMTSVSGNFKFDISEEMIGVETYIEVYHQDYERAKRIVKIVEGDISRKTSSTTGEEITIDSSNEIILDSIDATSKNKVKHGENIEIWIEINNISETVGEEILTIINDNLNGNTLGAVYDISLYKKLESDTDKVKLETTNEELTFSLKIPDNLVNKNKKLLRTYKIVRIHNGDVETIDASYNKSKQTITFSSDKFSEFTLIYKDIKNPKTGDNINLYIAIAILSTIGLTTGTIYLRKESMR